MERFRLSRAFDSRDLHNHLGFCYRRRCTNVRGRPTAAVQPTRYRSSYVHSKSPNIGIVTEKTTVSLPHRLSRGCRRNSVREGSKIFVTCRCTRLHRAQGWTMRTHAAKPIWDRHPASTVKPLQMKALDTSRLSIRSPVRHLVFISC